MHHLATILIALPVFGALVGAAVYTAKQNKRGGCAGCPKGGSCTNCTAHPLDTSPP